VLKASSTRAIPHGPGMAVSSMGPAGFIGDLDGHRSLQREYARILVALLAIPLMTWLAWLVAHREPLPASSVGSAAMATIVLCLLVIMTMSTVQGLPLVSFPVLLLAVTFLFTCSPFVLYLLQGKSAFDGWEFVDIKSVLLGLPMVLLAFMSFLFGSMLSRPSLTKSVRANRLLSGERGSYRRTLRSVGLAMYGFSALTILAFTLAGGALSLSYQGGYQAFHGAKRGGQLSQLVGVSMSRLLPWSLLILVATSRDRRSRRLVLLLAIPALGAMFASGDRSGPIPVIMLIASGMFLLGARIDWKRSLGVAALIVLIIPIILNLRKVPLSQWSPSVFAKAATNQVEATPTFGQSFLGGFLVSLSASYQTLMATVEAVPQREPYHDGRDYLSSLVVAIPFHGVFESLLGVNVREQSPSDWVLLVLHPGRTAGPGYLQLAEAYLEFGVVGIIGLYLLLGWGLTRLWRSAAAKVGDPRHLAFTLIVVSETLIWVRNSSSLFVRAVAWGWLLVYAAPAVIRKVAGPSTLVFGDEISHQSAAALPDSVATPVLLAEEGLATGPHVSERVRAPRRVLYVFGSLERAGAQLRTLEVSRELWRDGTFSFDFCTLDLGPTEIADDIATLGGTVHVVSIRSPRFLRDFPKLLRARRYDVVVAEPQFLSGIIVWLAAREGVAVRIVAIRNSIGDSSTAKSRVVRTVLCSKLFVRWMRGLTKRFATDVAAVSQSALASVLPPPWQPDGRCRVIYNGFDLARFQVPADTIGVREEFGWPVDSRIVVNVGRLSMQKNHATILAATQRLRADDDGLRLLLVGGGKDSGDVERLIDRFELGDICALTTDRTDVARLLLASDVFLFPSLWEGLPGAALEALAAGLPVVASDIPPIREIDPFFPGSILVASPADVEKHADHVRRALDMPRDRAAALVRFANTPFFLPNAVNAYRSLYQVDE
jgi:glycosyltransferase involved in cell wall biosynthesis